MAGSAGAEAIEKETKMVCWFDVLLMMWAIMTEQTKMDGGRGQRVESANAGSAGAH
jgi:hypothetical protein